MFELFKLVGRVMVDASGANQALDGTDKKAQGVTGNLGGYMDKLKSWAAAAGAAIAGSAIAKGLKEIWDISSQVAEIGDNIDKASQKFMLSRQAFQEWSFVAQRSGFDINQLGQAVVDLSKKVGEGKEDILSVLEEIGISAAEAMTATPEELFEMVIEGLQGVGESTRRAYLADKLLGGSAKELNPLLNMSADATKELKDEVNALGGVMSDQLVDQSAKFQDSQTNLQAAWDGVKYHLAENTLPAMTQIVDGLTLLLTGDFVNGLTTAADGVKSYLGGILSVVNEWAIGIRTAIESALNIDLGPFMATASNFFPYSPSIQRERDQWFDDLMSNYSPGLDIGQEPKDLFSGGFSFDFFGKTYRFGHASGIEFVPRNDYPATLHYGERVLTRQEAEEYNAGKSGGGNTTINISTVAQSPAQTAAAITAAMARARWAM